jgi:hypothetical protein
MNEGLDAALVLETEGGKPSKQYRTSPYTVCQYCDLPYAQRVAVDAECDALAGIERTSYADETSVQPYTVGRATQKVKGARQAPFKSAQPAQLPSTTSQPLTAMTTPYVHPAPSPALHTLNAPERIAHDETHPDNLTTYAAPAPRNVADLLDVVSRYVVLTEREGETDWTHWGPSPFLRGDTHSFAVNIAEGLYKCFTSLKMGDVVDFVMFMEELSETEALDWLKTNFPNYYGSEPAAEPAPTPADETAHADFAFTAAGLPEAAPLAALADAVGLASDAAPAASVAHEGIVYETTNYDLFQLLPENRVVDTNHVRKLVAQIRENNLLRIKPLDVTPEMGVIDGQHRLAAARELGLPIYYKIGQQLNEAAITALNVGQRNWQATDYLHYWTVKGKPSYVAFTDFRTRHPRISFSNAKIMLSGVSGGRGSDPFRLGQWEGAGEAEVAVAEQVAMLVERIGAETPFKFSAHTGFVGALYHCVTRVEGFDANEMMRTILAQPLSLVPCASHKQWLEMLSRIYNHFKREENRIRFE